MCVCVCVFYVCRIFAGHILQKSLTISGCYFADSFTRHNASHWSYGVATISRMFKNIGRFAEYRSLLKISFAKDTYAFKHPSNLSHPMRHPMGLRDHVFALSRNLARVGMLRKLNVVLHI